MLHHVYNPFILNLNFSSPSPVVVQLLVWGCCKPPDHIWKPLYGPNVTDVIHSEGVRPCHFLTNQGAKKVTVTAPSSPLLTAAILSHLIEPLSMKVNGHPPVTSIVISDDVAQVFVRCRDTTASLCVIYSTKQDPCKSKSTFGILSKWNCVKCFQISCCLLDCLFSYIIFRKVVKGYLQYLMFYSKYVMIYRNCEPFVTFETFVTSIFENPFDKWVLLPLPI